MPLRLRCANGSSMKLSLLVSIPICQLRARLGVRAVRNVPRPPCGVLTNRSISTSQSFIKQHQEVLQDSEWYGPEKPDHTSSPATVAATPAAAATRGDVRLIASFTKFLNSNKLDLSALFCRESILSADSRVVCDLQTGHHGELLSEFLTSGALRVGEELPHWFVNGNLRGAIKCYMATRSGAAALEEAISSGAGRPAVQQQHQALVASVLERDPLGPTVSPLMDDLLAAMPAWNPASLQELAGWESADDVRATVEDVAMLHCFGVLVYASRLDVAEFLQQLCGADPFSWTMAQVAQGVISEPEPWLLERFFMSKHSVGEALPLWFAKWGVSQEIDRWLSSHKAVQLVQEVLAARGISPSSSDAISERTVSLAEETVTAACGSVSRDALTEALDVLEANVAGLLSSCLSREGLEPLPTAAAITCLRYAQLYDRTDALGALYAVDLLATCSSGGQDQQEGILAALVAVAVQLPCGGGAAGDVAMAVRRAKERLDWLDFLLRQEGILLPTGAVAKVLLLLPPRYQQQQRQGPAAAGEVVPDTIPQSILRYLEQYSVMCVRASDLATR